jgi:hypothetical protein
VAGLPAPSVADAQSTPCTRYVDNQAGSDGNGTLANPWNNIQGHIGGLVAGDVLCVRGTASGAPRVYDVPSLTVNNSGTTSSPITLQAYPGEHARLRHIASATTVMFRLYGHDWVVRDLAFDNNGTRFAVFELREGSNGWSFYNVEVFNGWYHGFKVHSDNFRIENSRVFQFNPENTDDGECIWVSRDSDNITIRGNTIHDCQGNGIEISNDPYAAVDPAIVSENVLIEYNTIYRGTIDAAETGIGFKQGYHVIVRHNNVYGIGTGPGEKNSPALGIHRLVRDVLVENNYFHDTSVGIRLYHDDGGEPTDVIVRNNLFDTLTGDGSPAGAGIDIAGCTRCQIVHNTIYRANGPAIGIAGDGMTGPGRVQNNLMVASGSFIRTNSAIWTAMTVSHNGRFDTGVYQLSGAGDIVGTGDPGFANAAGHDFHLDVNSRALDQGVQLSVFSDYDGDARPFGCRPDLGAYEYRPTAAAAASVNFDVALPANVALAASRIYLPAVINVVCS